MPHMTPSLEMRLQLGTQCIDIGTKESPYRLLENGVRGIDGPPFHAEMREAAHLDGGVCVSARVPSRKIELDFEIVPSEESEHLRAALISFFSPKESGVLSVTRCGVTRYIACRLAEGITLTQPTLHHPVRVHVALICPDPYFYGKEETAILRAGAAGMIYFPFTLSEEGGITGGVLGGEHSLSIDNRGDGETGFYMVLGITDGDGYEGAGCEMSGITLSSRGHDGDKMHIDVSLTKGDTLEICTFPGAKYVRKNGEVCMRFSPESRFFALGRGISIIDLTFETLHGLPQASVSLRPSYLGV